jgi:nucleotide-binding universal stress UspA family protein
MWTIRKILVPTDLSAAAERALQCAVDLAAQHAATVTVLNASEAPLRTYYPGGFGADREAMEKVVAAHAQKGVAIDIIQRDGPAVEAIARVAHELGANLIVMGTHGRSGLGRAVLGSVTEQVLRASNVPVLTVRADPAGIEVTATSR